MSLSQGQVIHEKYRIAKRMGGSEFGAVYRAWDLEHNVPVALQEVITNDEQEIAQLEALAQRLIALQHSNLPKILDAFTLPGQGFYLVAEFIEGEDLQMVFERRDAPLEIQQAVEWVSKGCDALSYLHRQSPNILHGNVKPSSFRINPAGEVILVGFGDIGVSNPQVRSALAVRGVSPGFSPPEQYGKGQMDERSDVYALGATLYVLLGGKRLPESVLIKGKDVTPPRPLRELNPMVSEALNDVVMRAIAIDATQRYPSVLQFKQALQEAVYAAEKVTQPSATRPSWVWILGGLFAVVVLLGILIGGGLFLYNEFIRERTPTPQATETAFTATPEGSATPTQTEVPTPTSEATPTALPTRIEDEQGVLMALVPAGPFLMGSNYGAEEERPEHTVTLDDFYIDLYEVTNALYAVCVQARACRQPLQVSSATHTDYYGNAEFADFPVLHVTWSMAQDYCTWRGGRLPTEAEWEKAARGTDGRLFPWGMEATCQLANFWMSGAGCLGEVTRVGSYPSGVSPFGLFDMAGNVWEWVMDWFDPTYYARSPAENPTGPEEGIHRVVRGGAWHGGVYQIRTTTRGRNLPDQGYNYVGFRCVRLP